MESPGDPASRSPDLVVLVCACASLATAPLLPFHTAHLSSRLGLASPMTRDPLGAGLAAVSVLLILALFLLAFRASRRTRAVRTALVGTLALFLVALPMLDDIVARHDLGLRQGDRQVSLAHDGGVLQTEAAMAMLLEGRSPYGADFGDTLMAQGIDSRPELWHPLGLERNPALSAFPYPPGVLWVSLPGFVVTTHLVGFFDQRLVHLLALVLLAVAAWHLPRDPQWRLPMVAATVLNPVNTLFLQLGMNDVLVLAALFGCLWAASRGRLKTAFVVLGIACTLKPFAWPLIPLMVAWAWTRLRMGCGPRQAGGRLARLLLPMVAIGVAAFGPFLIQTPGALLHDLFLFQARDFPLRPLGLGISGLGIATGLLTSPRDALPTLLLHLGIVLPALGIGIVLAGRSGRLTTTIAAFAAVLLLWMFVSRQFAHNYLGVFLAMAMAAMVLGEPAVHREGATSDSTGTARSTGMPPTRVGLIGANPDVPARSTTPTGGQEAATDAP